MAVFVSDTFTEASDTTLASHTGETGASWTLHPSYSGTCTVNAANDLLLKDTANTAAYYASGTPSGAEYDIEYDFIETAANDGGFGCFGRLSTSANTGYHVRYRASADLWQLYKISAGSFSLLGSYTQSLTASQVYAVKFEILDASKKVYIDGVERISSTNNDITAAGKAGVRYYVAGVDDYSDLRIDNFVATDDSVAGGATGKSNPIMGPMGGPLAGMIG